MSDEHASSNIPQVRGSKFADWDPNAALADLAEECHVIDNDDPYATAQRLLEAGLPAVAMQAVNLALYGSTEKIRLDATRLCLDRTMGPANLAYQETRSRKSDPLDEAIKLLTQFAEVNPGAVPEE